jgi:hypothetical protein
MINGDAFDAAFDDYTASAGLAAAGIDIEVLRSFMMAHTLPKARLASLLNGLRDELAAIEHDRWAHWQRYIHAQCRADAGEAGALVIPAKLVEQWSWQADTRFSDLTEAEQDSDREQVDRYLPFLIRRLSD